MRSNILVVLLGSATLAIAPAAHADTPDYTADFRVTSAALTSSTLVGSNPWTYEAGQGWRVANVSSVAQSRLFLPTFTSVTGGAYSLSLTHRFNLEDTYDGARVLASVNGGAFTAITPSSGAGYTDVISAGFASPIGGQMAFSGASTSFVTSLFSGMLGAGDQIQFAFDVAWDNSIAAGNPGWQLESVAADLSATTVTPEPGTWALMGTGLLGLAAVARRRRNA